MNTQDTSGFFGGQPPAAKFDAEGDTIEGVVMAKELRQQTDPQDASTVLTWPDGRPKMQALVTLQVAKPDEDDDGLRILYVRGYMQRAIVQALRAQHLRDLPINAHLKVTWASTDAPTVKGHDGARQYEAEIKLPTRRTAGRGAGKVRNAPDTDAPTPDAPPDDQPPF